MAVCMISLFHYEFRTAHLDVQFDSAHFPMETENTIAAGFSKNMNFLLGGGHRTALAAGAHSKSWKLPFHLSFKYSFGDLREVTRAFHVCQPRADNVAWRESQYEAPAYWFGVTLAILARLNEPDNRDTPPPGKTVAHRMDLAWRIEQKVSRFRTGRLSCSLGRRRLRNSGYCSLPVPACIVRPKP